MYFNGGMEKISEPKVKFIGGREDTELELKEREPSIALLWNKILPLYLFFMSKYESLITFFFLINDVLRI